MAGSGDENSLLLVDDNVFLTQAWSRLLGLNGYAVTVAETLQAASHFVADWSARAFRYVLLDVKLPDGDGTSLLPLLAALTPRPRVAVVTSHLTCERSLDLRGQCELSVPKPNSMASILQLMDALVGREQQASKPARALGLFAAKHGLSSRQTALISHTMLGPDVQTDAALGCKMTTVRSLWHRVFTKTGYRSQVEVIRAVLRMTVD